MLLSQSGSERIEPGKPSRLSVDHKRVWESDVISGSCITFALVVPYGTYSSLYITASSFRRRSGKDSELSNTEIVAQTATLSVNKELSYHMRQKLTLRDINTSSENLCVSP